MVRSIPPKRGSGSLASRLGGRLGVAPGGGQVKDARLKIMNRNPKDARSKLTRQKDARERLEKLKTIKSGTVVEKNLGNITVMKKRDGKISLSTNKTKAAPTKKVVEQPKEVRQVGKFTKTVMGSGNIAFSTAKAKPGMRSGAGMRSDEGRRQRPTQETAARPSSGPVRSRQSEQDRLDEELMNAEVNREELNRIRDYRATKQTRSRSPLDPRSRSPLRPRGRSPQQRPRSPQRSRSPIRRSPVMRSRSPLRSRSPIRRSRSPVRGSGRSSPLRPVNNRREVSPAGGRRQVDRYDFDQPRRVEDDRRRREEDVGRRREDDYDERITMGGRMEQGSKVSPLQGSKVVITNLQTSVTQEDILELFGDVGPLRRAKLLSPGHAEVTFVEYRHAVKAVEIYHNRQLDGKPMKCQQTGSNSAPSTNTKIPRSLAKSKSGEDGPAPDVDSIHRALFFSKSKPAASKKQTFTITMPKKGKEEPDYYD